MHRLGSTAARLKLKGIDGGPHKRWSMWLNSMQREEPYLGLTCPSYPRESGESVRPDGAQVLHGCRQLVPWGVGLSPATSATPVVSCHLQGNAESTLTRLPVISGRKVGMTSSQYGPYAQGCTRATMVGTKGRKTARWSKSPKPAPVQIGVCNSTP